MRHSMFLLLAALLFSCSTTKKGSSSSSLLNGSWTPIKLEITGKASIPANILRPFTSWSINNCS